MTTHRLFLSQVNQTIDRSTLVQGISKVFETYGEVVEVFVPERSKKAYAFVTLESYNPDAAQRAAAELGRKEKSQDVELFQGIQPAQAMRNQKQLKLDQEWKRKFELASKSNIICQVHTSHVERLIDYVSNTTDKNLPESIKVSIMGSLSSTNTMSLVFLGVLPQPKVFVEWLESIWFVQPKIHRIFTFDGSTNDETSSVKDYPWIIRGSLETDVVQAIWKKVSGDKKDQTKFVIRLHVFPPRQQLPLLQALEQTRQNHPREAIQFSPKNSTHTVGIIQLDSGSGPDKKGGLYVATPLQKISQPPLSFSSPPSKVPTHDNNDYHNNSKSKGKVLCRAYWKLQEAFERYNFCDSPTSQSHRTKKVVALDCGAAPGGWTQFLLRAFDCSIIYSIDPGQLDPSIFEGNSIVQYWPMTIQKALPKLQQDLSAANKTVNIWVSDMCVKDMEQQVDWLLQAREMAIVTDGTFFVLTLKCIVGHSTTTFDLLVDAQVKRLQGISRQVERVHLFANRFSERTIMGYLT